MNLTCLDSPPQNDVFPKFKLGSKEEAVNSGMYIRIIM